MSRSRDQQDALLDVWEQCAAVSYAHQQCLYHKEHLAGKSHHPCQKASVASNRCDRAGEKVELALTESLDKLSALYKEAVEEGAEEALLDLICIDRLPEVVATRIYQEAA